MNFEYFRLLILAHILSKRWSVLGQLGHNPDDDLSEEDWKLLDEIPKSTHVNVYNAVKNRLLNLKGGIKILNGDQQKMWKEWEELIRKRVDADSTYDSPARAVKIPDWIEEIEIKQFPRWLYYVKINHYYKWIIALYVAEGNFFNKLRSDMKQKCISYQKFAAEISSMYDNTYTLFAQNLSSIPKPEPNQVERFCQYIGIQIIIASAPSADEAKSFLYKNDIRATTFVCEVLVSPIPHATKTNQLAVNVTHLVSSSTTIPSHLIKFYIIVTNVPSTGQDFENQYTNILTEIEKICEFATNECTIIKSYQLPGNVKHNMPNWQQNMLGRHSAGMLFHIGLKMDLEDEKNPEWKNNYAKYKNVQSQILQKIQPLVLGAKITIQDDYYFITTPPPTTVPPSNNKPSH